MGGGERKGIVGYVFCNHVRGRCAEFEDGKAHPPRYVRKPFEKEPDFGVTSVNYDWKKLWKLGEPPD